jgi:hypothetical protein
VERITCLLFGLLVSGFGFRVSCVFEGRFESEIVQNPIRYELKTVHSISVESSQKCASVHTVSCSEKVSCFGVELLSKLKKWRRLQVNLAVRGTKIIWKLGLLVG